MNKFIFVVLGLTYMAFLFGKIDAACDSGPLAVQTTVQPTMQTTVQTTEETTVPPLVATVDPNVDPNGYCKPLYDAAGANAATTCQYDSECQGGLVCVNGGQLIICECPIYKAIVKNGNPCAGGDAFYLCNSYSCTNNRC